VREIRHRHSVGDAIRNRCPDVKPVCQDLFRAAREKILDRLMFDAMKRARSICVR
jgi:hypothetical protein